MSAKKRWAVGDWCFFQYELHQVKEMEGDKVTSLSSGIINTGGRDLSDQMLPVSLETKVISEAVAADIRAVREAERGVGLNWPHIAWRFRVLWFEWASNPNREEGWKPSRDLRDGLLKAMKATYALEVDGIRVFGR